MNGISDENVFTLQLDEFICLICQMAMQLYARSCSSLCGCLTAKKTLTGCIDAGFAGVTWPAL